jgi:hypothetical protein
MISKRKLTLVLIAVAAIAAPGSAFAKSQFPRAIERDLALSYAPSCALCHYDGATGPGTVRTPFGLSAIARGLSASNSNSIDAAIAQMVVDKVDSDGDGVSDTDELKAGTDPNTAAPVSAAEYPAGGCGASPRRTSTGRSTTTGLVATLAAIWPFPLRSRRRRRGAQSGQGRVDSG